MICYVNARRNDIIRGNHRIEQTACYELFSPEVNANGIPDECEQGCLFGRGDVNNDTRVDGEDIPGFVGCLMGASSNCACADMNGDGMVDLCDLSEFVSEALYGSGR